MTSFEFPELEEIEWVTVTRRPGDTAVVDSNVDDDIAIALLTYGIHILADPEKVIEIDDNGEEVIDEEV